MRVFVTGATGFIGSRIVAELIAAGYQVLGLARSDEKAAALAATGAEVLRGSIEDLEGLQEGARLSDGVIHTAFNHDFSRYVQNCEDDRRVIESIGKALAGTKKPLLVTSGAGLSLSAPGVPARETDKAAPSSRVPRAASEEAAASVAAKGVPVSIVRLPQVHDTVRQGLVTFAIALAREKGVSAYVGEGENRWTAAHVSDVARLYRLALEKAQPGAVYQAVAEEGISYRSIAEVLGRRLGLPVRSIAPEEAESHFGWLTAFAARDVPASGELTRKALGWTPSGPGLLADLENLSEAAL